MNHPPIDYPTIDLLHDDRWVIAAWKPGGLSTVCPPGGQSLQSVLAAELKIPTQSLWMVHRLDRLTTGIVLIARTKSAAALLSKQFAAGKIEKSYTATVSLSPDWENPFGSDASQRWEDFLAKIPGHAQVRICDADDSAAKKCVTDATLLQIDPQQRLATLRLHPRTGRMHQLRLQTSRRGMPIIGDPVYGDQIVDRAVDVDPPMGLVADKIEFFHPKTASRIKLSRPWSGDDGGKLSAGRRNG